MHGKWAYKKYISFNNFTAKKAKEQKIKLVRREIKAKRVQRPPPKAEPVVSKDKDALIRSIQIRWWYLLPDWPESDYDYTPGLLEKGLKVVPDRDLSADTREPGITDKVKTIGGFPGLFLNRRGRIYDLRDKSTCPSYNNLAEKTEEELEIMLKVAIQNQLGELKAQDGFDVALAVKLEETKAGRGILGKG